MKITGNTILITGGATGIGFSLAEHFVNAGNEVVICGRRKNKLEEAKRKLPKIHIKVCDVTKPDNRESLLKWVISNFKNINILVNNAGIQRAIDLKKGPDRLRREDEIDTNLKAPICLSSLFIPTLLRQKQAAIINISSGLGFVPIASMPIYCATKAAIHSFSISLRHQLRNTSIKVFEIIPPAVDTELDKGRNGESNRGIHPSEVAKATLNALEKDEFELAIGMAENLRVAASKNNFDQIFKSINH
jgi:uncharacterized oxidoreductase